MLKNKVGVVLVLVCFLSSSLVEGLPVPPPNLLDCAPIQARDDLLVDCCLPTGVKIKEFQFPDANEPVRVRKNAASLDEETIEKINQAYLKMRALPANDPRSMNVQQNIHCGYCTEVFLQQNSTKKLEIHRNWLLLPFHRWYVYFHERILASLIDDPTFAIPYWNWDNQSSIHHPSPNAIPEWMYTKPGLYDENRDPDHAPPALADLHWGPFFGDEVPPGTTDAELRNLNNAFLYEAIVSGGTLPDLFMGGLYRFDEDLPYTPALYEIGPHAAIHGWVGSSTMPKGEDMAPSYTAARDPMFFAHHSNVDRMFRDWKALGGRRNFPWDTDWWNSSFLFYDEKGEMVRVTVAQSLDIDRLRYTFEPSENAWVEDPTTPLSTAESSTPGMRYWAAKTVSSMFSLVGFSVNPLSNLLLDIPDVESVRDPRFSASVFRSRVARPHAALRAAGKLDHLEEVLVVDRIWVPSKKPVWFDIFINLPEADGTTPLNATEWCGRFSNGPHLDRAEHMERESVFSVSIGEKLKKLGIAHQPSVVVSLVPRGPQKHLREVQIRTVKVELR